MRRLVLLPWCLGALVLASMLGLASQAAASPLRGTVTLPAELRTGRRFPGYWRVENGSVPISSAGKRPDMVVVVGGVKGAPPAAKTVTVDIAGLGASPATLVIGLGSVVEFKNSDRVPHDLYIPGQDALMPVQRLSPGALRHQKFSVAGGYEVRCALYPHIAVNIVVVDSPYFAQVDDKGAFKIDVPDGHATLKVWSLGRWLYDDAVDVKPGMADQQVRIAESAGKDSGE